MESSDDILYLVLADSKVIADTEHQVLKVPVVDHECQVVFDLYLLSYLIAATESVSHDRDQHIQHMD